MICLTEECAAGFGVLGCFPAFTVGVGYRCDLVLRDVSVCSSSTLRAADKNRSSPKPPAVVLEL